MNQDWIFHHSHEDFYRSPFGAVSCEQRIRLRVAIDTAAAPEGVLEAVYLRLWINDRDEEKIPMMRVEDRGEKIVYETQFDAPWEAGLLWYYFIIIHQGKTYYYGNNDSILGGKGQITEDTPPSYQITVYHKGAKTPDWFKEGVMYQIFVDRFYNGTEDGSILNPRERCLIHPHWDDDPIYIRDMYKGDVLRWDFFGGNLLGVIKKLPYLKELGVSVIYFNPIFEATSNHKYDTGDYHKIDFMFGDNEMFQTLCQVAKEMGISIILDGVFSHTGSDSIYFNKEGSYPQLGAYQSPDSPYFSWYRFIEYPHKYESWWGVDDLPNVNELEPSYQNFIIHNHDSVAKYWIDQGAKGWRLDVVDELPDEFVKMLYTTLKEKDPDSILIGEVWEDASNKVSYGKRRGYLLGEELDSVMNYPFKEVVINFMMGHIDAERAHEILMSLCENYPLEYFYSTMNLIGSHDVPRILTILGGGNCDESIPETERGKIRLSPDMYALGIARLKLSALFQMTFPGVPCIYYGDEAGMEGCGDPYCRGTYPWGRENQDLLSWYKEIVELRNKYPMFKTGQWIPLYAEGDVYGYARKISGGKDIFGQEKNDGFAVVAFNRNLDGEKNFTVNLSELYQGESLVDVLADNQQVQLTEGILSLVLKPLEGKVLLMEESTKWN